MTTDKPPKLFYSLREAAEASGVSTSLLQRAIHSGRLRAKRTGRDSTGNYLISGDQLWAWFEQLDDA